MKIDLNRGALPFRFDPPDAIESSLEVPKRLHFIWIGSIIPNKYVDNIWRFAEHNPDYKITVWLDRCWKFSLSNVLFHSTQAMTEREMQNRDLFDRATNLGERADLLRYELVYRYGGIYLDVDTISHGPGSLHPDMRRAFLTPSDDPWFNTTNSHFGFAKGSEFLAYVIKNLRDPRLRTLGEIPERTGPTFLTTCLLSFGDMRLLYEDGRELLKGLTHTADANWVGK